LLTNEHTLGIPQQGKDGGGDEIDEAGGGFVGGDIGGINGEIDGVGGYDVVAGGDAGSGGDGVGDDVGRGVGGGGAGGLGGGSGGGNAEAMERLILRLLSIDCVQRPSAAHVLENALFGTIWRENVMYMQI